MVQIVLTMRVKPRRGSRGGSGIHRLAEWPSVPGMHDAVVVMEGESPRIIDRVVWSTQGRAQVILGMPVSLDEADLLIEKHGWQPDFAPPDEHWRFARTHRFVVER